MNRINYAFSATIVFVLIICSCTKSNDKVKVKFINKTGEELKDLNVGKKRIGKLTVDDSTKFIPFNAFHFDSGIPDEPISAKIDHEKTADFSEFYWCGTEKTIVEEGTFEIEIHKLSYDNKIYLKLVKR